MIKKFKEKELEIGMQTLLMKKNIFVIHQELPVQQNYKN